MIIRKVEIDHQEYDGVICCVCGVQYFIPRPLNQLIRSRRGKVYCPNGDEWHYKPADKCSDRPTAQILKLMPGGKDGAA